MAATTAAEQLDTGTQAQAQTATPRATHATARGHGWTNLALPHNEVLQAQQGSEDARTAKQRTGVLAGAETNQEEPIEHIVADLEAHLRSEMHVATAFAKNPSARSLWMN